MTLCQFNALDEMEQAKAVSNGKRLADRQEELYVIILYQVETFFVEVYYHRQFNVIVKIRSFSNYDQLLPFAGKIKIEE